MLKSLVAASLAVVLSGCAGHAMKGGLLFVSSTPESISTAWRDARGDVWLVPSKGTIVERIEGSAGERVSWRVNGSYLVAAQAPERMKVVVDGSAWPLVVPDFPKN